MIINGLEVLALRIETTGLDFLLVLLHEFEYPMCEIVLGNYVFQRRRRRQLPTTEVEGLSLKEN